MQFELLYRFGPDCDPESPDIALQLVGALLNRIDAGLDSIWFEHGEASIHVVYARHHDR